MSRVVFRDERCKGCLLCTAACPSEIIVQSQRFNQQGYKVVEVADQDMDKCKGCAFCAMVCPDNVITVFRSSATKENDNAA
ncbi:4Fe-4S dicluster domain-containing protein [Desulfohalobium retbaense]|uniref:4Fe-4S ferredoxin iron-sulfur binding domain protein n=1 Tax=Desulfohalobium retbaense (strain ATCC 49708 / DSM 5692 / JCM 16813 / HR100) TaxID=485915 RepID=C8WZB9_DESRD|nr:4Fe-4S dicluster domain-containing protein [Desulfohalobium retbaense]ACV67394.1 4Fe-4S ferredoxin iron-sulfur binding domain protein [Desulfohalobium retbaense DSM 5692]